MPPDHILTICLCMEDTDAVQCDVIINQIARGHVFGTDQPFYLMLHGSDICQLEDLCLEVQDCAYPLVKGVSVYTTLSDTAPVPDVFLVLLSNRSICYTDTPAQQFQQLFTLVTYIIRLSEFLSSHLLDSTKILVAGDMALTAAALLSHKLKGKPTARQLMAIDGQLRMKKSQPREASRQYSKISRLCDTVRQWWSGMKDSLASAYLGVKFWHAGKNAAVSQGSGYFFSAPVDFDGPMTFHTKRDLDLHPDYINAVKVTTDTALSLVHEIDRNHKEGDSCEVEIHLAHL